jgi:anaerobic dimethyl sulfoxide reductase subunit A
MNQQNLNKHDNDIRIVPTSCLHNCGGRCLLRAHIKNGEIIRIDTDNGEAPQLRACARGRSYRQRVYSPERLKYPLRRTGERGKGDFERISWDEALDIVAAEMFKIRETYGNSAIFLIAGSGNAGGTIHSTLNFATPVGHMLDCFGGFTGSWGIPSFEGTLFASLATYGTSNTGNSWDDLPNSRMIIMWGWNPAETWQGQDTNLCLAQARDHGTKIVVIDPRYTDSAALFAQQWIPIRPGTDTAMLTAMAHVIITNNLHDQAFIDRYTAGFGQYRDYILGDEDGIPKTPEWAEPITKVPAEIIVDLAREYATRKPAALVLGFGPARSAMGEQCARAAIVLTVITGNIGISGGNACGMLLYRKKKTPGIKSSESTNPVERNGTRIRNALYKLKEAPVPSTALIHGNKVYDAILKGRAGGYPADIKMIYVVGDNFLNQRNNVRKATKAFKSLDFVVVHEQFMTPTARFADILLPVNTFMERSDICSSTRAHFYLPGIIGSLYESKTDLEICRELSKKLGIPDAFGDETEDMLLAEIARERGLDYDALKQDGFIKKRWSEPFVAFKPQIEDPENNPFPTVSGKIEIYCQHIAEMDDPLLPPIPKYISSWENYDDSLSAKYPLQLITAHYKLRAHSTYYNIPWLRELDSHSVWINSADAKARGISDGSLVYVYNDRGRIRISAKVTERIMPGVVNLYQGSWYQPDGEGVDIGGCANMLTKDEQSPGGAYPFNTALVQVEPVLEE